MTSANDRISDTFAYHLAQVTWPPANAYIARLEFDATHAAGAATRRALEAHLLERVQDDELELLKTLACELVANAVNHDGHRAKARVELLLGASPEFLRVEVRDEGPGFERQRSPSPHRDGGGVRTAPRGPDRRPLGCLPRRRQLRLVRTRLLKDRVRPRRPRR